MLYGMYMGPEIYHHEYLHNVSYREAFSPALPIDEVPAHCFLRSVHNITIERGWLNLQLQWGDNIVIAWDQGEGVYNPSNPKH